jgi:hypothetical protein
MHCYWWKEFQDFVWVFDCVTLPKKLNLGSMNVKVLMPWTSIEKDLKICCFLNQAHKIRKFSDLRCDCANEIVGICIVRVISGSLLVKPLRVGAFSWKQLKSPDGFFQ